MVRIERRCNLTRTICRGTLRALTSRQVLALALEVYDGLPHAMIAARLGICRSAATRLIGRARRRLTAMSTR